MLGLRNSWGASRKLHAAQRCSDRLEDDIVEGLQEHVMKEHDHEGLGDLAQAPLHEADHVWKVPKIEIKPPTK